MAFESAANKPHAVIYMLLLGFAGSGSPRTSYQRRGYQDRLKMCVLAGSLAIWLIVNQRNDSPGANLKIGEAISPTQP